MDEKRTKQIAKYSVAFTVLSALVITAGVGILSRAPRHAWVAVGILMVPILLTISIIGYKYAFWLARMLTRK